ncbi:MAG: hypothetical protein OXC37_05715 [Bdellovibrionaceae bacterium]|nr:hypothetical protein [Pseudobdellovibrionaceae bacterium]
MDALEVIKEKGRWEGEKKDEKNLKKQIKLVIKHNKILKNLVKP